ncbi:Glyoxalase/Bleomycin resistance protein/Dihydroxybiphenyl dioxygenase [Ilyonectria sp. MPI-CAGE-AT-0026]|nr:Glyoxalase/Bleomycin resistance protein/Dihydroxybiphenyl dioxygenase [Ilyonectria sp. MPI-CAGE-AT-0026]
MASLRLGVVQNHPSKIQLERISHVYFEHPDLDDFGKFALDFGLVEAWRSDDVVLYRGYSKDPYCYVARKAPAGTAAFGGGAWIAQTQEDFDKVAAMEGAEVSNLAPYPGGGRRVTLKTPSGFLIHVLSGQVERPACESAPSAVVDNLGPFNGSISKHRLGKFVFLCLHRSYGLNNYGFIVAKWDEEIKWYTSNFNIVPSDVLSLPTNNDIDVIAFMHLDLGERFSDHHSLFLSRAAPGEHDRLHHTSYEVEDFDTQLLGHDWLASKGHKAVWGVGRHILGSQIFDYWRDPSGFIIEHYTDGDLVNVHAGTKRGIAGPLSVCGPEMPPEMTEDGVKATRHELHVIG